MKKAFGVVVWNEEYGTHSYACEFCYQGGLTDPDADSVEPITLSDIREEAIVCDECDEMILPSEETWLEGTEDERDAFESEGTNID